MLLPMVTKSVIARGECNTKDYADRDRVYFVVLCRGFNSLLTLALSSRIPLNCSVCFRWSRSSDAEWQKCEDRERARVLVRVDISTKGKNPTWWWCCVDKVGIQVKPTKSIILCSFLVNLGRLGKDLQPIQQILVINDLKVGVIRLCYCMRGW